MQEKYTDNQSTKDKGDVLEQNVEHLFRVAKFKTSRNVRIASYEIDVVAELGDRRIIIECKNYQNSTITIRNLIHQWSSKNDIIGAHKIIIVIAGMSIKDSDRALASSLDITLWDEDDLGSLFKESLKPESFRNKLLENISLKRISISDRYRLDIMFELVQYAFSPSRDIKIQTKLSRLSQWLRAYILTEIEIQDIDRLKRIAHIELFEDAKNLERGRFFSRKDTDVVGYWNTLKTRLSDASYGNIVLDEATRGMYLSYMLELEREWESLERLFFESELNTRLSIQLKSRVALATISNSSFIFSISSRQGCKIQVQPSFEGFIIQVLSVAKNEADILEWILTSQHYLIQDPLNPSLKRYSWYAISSLDLIDKLSRILLDFFNLEDNETLLDTGIYKHFLDTQN